VVSAASGRGSGSGAGASPDGRALSTLVRQSSVSIGTSSQSGTGCGVTAFVRLRSSVGPSLQIQHFELGKLPKGVEQPNPQPAAPSCLSLVVSCRDFWSLVFLFPSISTCPLVLFRSCARPVLTRRILRYPVSPPVLTHRPTVQLQVQSLADSAVQPPPETLPRDYLDGNSRNPPPIVIARTRSIGALPVARRGDNELPNRAHSRARTGTGTKP
jgi:hypothetical protein